MIERKFQALEEKERAIEKMFDPLGFKRPLSGVKKTKNHIYMQDIREDYEKDLNDYGKM
jgi:hypothetical protein